MTDKISKAYNNKSFLNSAPARPIRVLCELLEPEERLEENNIKNTIIVFSVQPDLSLRLLLKQNLRIS